MQLGIIFDDENKSENYFSPNAKNSCFPVPIGTSLIDFIEMDFLRRNSTDLNTIENPILDFFIDEKQGKRDYSTLFDSEKIDNLLFNIKMALDFVLTDNFQGFSKLSIPQRYYLYEKYENIPNRIRYKETSSLLSYPVNGDYDIGKKYSDFIDSEAEFITDIPFAIREVYEAATYIDACYIIFQKMVKHEIKIRKCACCNRLFIPKDSSERYCNRVNKDGKTCKDIGYIKKVENNPLLKLYNTAYKSRHAEKQRLTRGKSPTTIEKFETALLEWRRNAKAVLDDCLSHYDENLEEPEKEALISKLKEAIDKHLNEYL